MRVPKKRRVSEQLRKAIQTSAMTQYAIAKKTGLSESQLSRFMNRKAELTLPAVDKLAYLLDLNLTADE